MPEISVPVWMTKQEISLAMTALQAKYESDGGGGALMSDLLDKLDLAKRSSATKAPATSPRRQPRKRNS